MDTHDSTPRRGTTISREYFEDMLRAARELQRVRIAVPPFLEFDVVRNNQYVTLHMGDEVYPTDHWNGVAVSAQLGDMLEQRLILALSDGRAQRAPWSFASFGNGAEAAFPVAVLSPFSPIKNPAKTAGPVPGGGGYRGSVADPPPSRKE